MAGRRPFWTLGESTQEYKIEYRYVQHNFTVGRTPNVVNAIVIHSMTDVLDNNINAVANWFNNPDSQVSAHYGVSSGGQILQFVLLSGTAWANGVKKPNHKWLWPGNPNPRTVSIECEGGPDDPISERMYGAVLYVCKRVLLVYPNITHLYAHNAIANTQCPGNRWLSGPLSKLATELNLVLVQ